jgi:plasmid stabilization system protein ParE
VTRTVVFRRPALREFQAGAIWYQAQRAGLGLDFELEVARAIESAADQPLRFPRMLGDIRCVRVRRFPYSVFFVAEARRLVVLAVFHALRHPLIWQARK